MKFSILTLFPQMFAPLQESILKRAQEQNKIEIEIINFRDYSKNKHKSVDDKVYGGGQGMLIACQPVYDCIQSIDPNHNALRVYLSAKGEVFSQQIATKLAKNYKHIILLCGHYEGIDERIIELCIDREISIGQFVLTGGELPAMVVVDAVARLCDGVLSSSNSFENESFYNGFLEEPHYTRPQEFLGKKVPNVLISGDHAQIEKWRKNKRKKI